MGDKTSPEDGCDPLVNQQISALLVALPLSDESNDTRSQPYSVRTGGYDGTPLVGSIRSSQPKMRPLLLLSQGATPRRYSPEPAAPGQASTPRSAEPVDMKRLLAPSVSAYAYNAQAVRDEEDALKKGRAAPPARSYKPLALRLPYIIVQIFVLCIALALTVYAVVSMPDSDSSDRDIPGEVRSSTLRSAGASSSSTPPAEAGRTGALLGRAVGTSKIVVTSVIVTVASTTVTRPATTVTSTRPRPDPVPDTTFSSSSRTIRIPSKTRFTTTFVTISRATETLPGSWYITGNVTMTRPGITTTRTSAVTVTRTGGGGGTEQIPIPGPSTELIEKVVNGEITVITIPHEPETKVVDNPATVVVPYTPPAETVIVTVGGSDSLAPAVIVVNPTAEPHMSPLIAGQAVTAFQPIVFTAISVIGGTLVTSVVTVVTTGADGLPTTATVTSVFMLGGMTTNVLVTTTPTGTLPLTLTVATTRGVSLVTSVFTPPPTSVTSVISGRSTTIVSTPPPRTSTSTGSSSTITSTSISTPNPKSTSDSFVVVATEVKENIGEAQYFAGVFLPLLVCLVLAAGLRIIDNQAKLFQPFFALSSPHGASGAESLTLQYAGPIGWIKPIVMGQPIPLLSQSILLLSSLMVPLSAEALGVRLHGGCGPASPSGCTARLGVSPRPAYALIVVLAVAIVLLAGLAVMLHRARTGLSANPWSVAGIASLAANPEIRVLEGDEATMTAAMTTRGRRYGFGRYEGFDVEGEYGIVLLEDPDRDIGRLLLQQQPGSDQEEGSDRASFRLGGPVPEPAAARFLALTVMWRAAFAVFLGGIFGLVLYYHLTLGQQSGFKTFMDSHSFGVRFLLALAGVVVTFFWLALFSSVTCMMPFKAMARRPQPPERSILVSRTSNGFYGLYRAARQREPYTFLVALMTCLAEALPAVLSNVPYKATQTLASHVACARISLVVLGAMLAVLLASFALDWPALPADPRSVGGLMYYVTDSYFVADLRGVSTLDGEVRSRRVRELGRRFYYAEGFCGRSGLRRRGGIDSDAGPDGQLGRVETEYKSAAPVYY
ncbi:hypothetical protein GGTG_00942 [Gaeumannomyces tritici R3-111a-1]|uniref:Zonadhesin n=1 Tax=Gaeumannomyces tritici (strain R3-111a-1) TaxID=644352 RepID=J3NI59_GAET3|nr:hypothetical protein GGTG_00942 [Gaeumannomyces tritici R3-111a-1]EJT80952.1 hypothetical protein GGTG_00942 [Gaeumannomyces tritici R3-111a-1]